MVTIRLRRFGKKKAPFYRVVVADKRSRRDGRVIEFVGHYDPKNEKNIATVKKERIEYWLNQGAHPSRTVAQLIKRLEKTA